MPLDDTSNDAEEMQPLTALEAIRLRPQMYLGEADSPELVTRLVRQALCHALDEAKSDSCSSVIVTVSPDTIQIAYNAGLPLKRLKSGNPKALHLFTDLYACRDAKSNLDVGDKYCNVGMAVVTALSAHLRVQTVSASQLYQLEFVRGSLTSASLQDFDTPDSTCLTFSPDQPLFPAPFSQELSLIEDLIEEIAGDFPNLHITAIEA